jgi:hypothetical protein
LDGILGILVDPDDWIDRINIHGAINLETGQARMIDVQTADAASTITLLEALETLYPLMMLICLGQASRPTPMTRKVLRKFQLSIPSGAAFLRIGLNTCVVILQHPNLNSRVR